MIGVFRKAPVRTQDARVRTALAAGGGRKGGGGGQLQRRRSVRALREVVGAHRSGTQRRHDAPPSSTTARPYGRGASVHAAWIVVIESQEGPSRPVARMRSMSEPNQKLPTPAS